MNLNRFMFYALLEIGTQEVLGPGSNPRIQQYFGATTLGDKTTDAVAWCSAFVNWCHTKAGFAGTRSARVRSWLEHPNYRPTNEPQLGDLCVFWRQSPASAKGHVGFFVREEGQHIWVLGGNQKNRVGVDKYPKNRLITYLTWVDHE